MQLGAAASSSTAPQQAAQTTPQAASTGKGKEMEQEQPPPTTEHQKEKPKQQEKMAEAPISIEHQAQESVPPRQETVVDASVLQTPLNEERTRKRDREQETPLTT